VRKRAAVLVTHTHWDREWYLSLDEYRFRLVELIDRLLSIIKKEPEYHSFWLDGQTVALDDYLEARPERQEEVNAALRAGKLLIGPWYGQPDEFMPSGESLVRNLALGVARMKQAGQDNRIGYVPDNFGHPSQLPQILRGFGIDNAFFWRGYREPEMERAEQTWTGADGSRIIAVCLVRGYSNMAYLLDAIEPEGDPAKKERVSESVKRLRRVCRGPLLLMNGVDHSLPIPRLSGRLARLEERFPDLRIRHGSLADVVAELRKKRLPDRLFRGELGHMPGYTSTGSARVAQKLAHARVEDMLVHYAEPLDAAAELLGGGAAPGFLRRAWRLLVKNQIHDSLSGSHADSVAQDMAVRFRRAEEIAAGVARQAFERIAGQRRDHALAALPASVLLYNPCAWKRSGLCELELDLPSSARDGRVVLLRNGVPLPFQELSDGPAKRLVFREHVNPVSEETRRIRMIADAGELGPASLCRLDVRLDPDAAGGAVRSRTPSLSPGVLDNGIVRVRVRGDGSCDLTDLRTGVMRRGLNRLADEPDAGNLYDSVHPAGWKKTTARTGRVLRTEDGPLQSSCEARTGIAVDGVSIPIRVRYTLRAGEGFVRTRVEVENRAAGHRLRTTFPLSADTRTILAHTPFDVVRRPLTAPLRRRWQKDGRDVIYEFNTEARAAQSFVAAVGKRGGLFVLSRGLHEYSAPPGGPLSVTLLRCVGEIFPHFTMYETGGGHCPGSIALEYGFGLSSSASPAGLLKLAQEYRLTPAAYEVFGESCGGDGLEIASVSRPGWFVTAIKRPEKGKGMVVRVLSLSRETTRGELSVGLPFRRAFLVRMDETDARGLPCRGGKVTLRLKPKQVATVLFDS